MSGLETAGLALGAFPILLRLLDDYRKGAEAAGDWWQIRRAYEEWKHDLDYHRTAFELNSKLILMPLMGDDELNGFLDHPTGEGWKDEVWETRLRERLPDSYEAVLRLVVKIYDIVESLKKELRIHNPEFQMRINEKHGIVKGKAALKNLFSAENIDFQKERFRLVLKNESRKRLSAQLKEANERLRDLIAGSDQVAAARRNRDHQGPPPTVNKQLQEYWRHAKRLHKALSRAADIHPSRSLCGCVGHIANLQLATKDLGKTEFGILFSGIDKYGGLNWSETRIEMISNVDIEGTSVACGVQPIGAGRAPRRVGFVEPNRSQEPPQTGRHDVRPIQNLCIELSKPRRTCIGFMDEDDQRFTIYSGVQSLANSKGSIMTLDSILHTSQSLTRRQRYCLAHTIASWFLCLGSTPWINLPIQANIVFFQDFTIPNRVNIEKVYIGGELSSSPSISTLDAIRSLGICLLELCFGYSLESYKDRNNLSGHIAALASLLDHAAAVQWSQEVCEEAGPDFAEAIEWCLQARSQDDGSWRKEIWAHVIVPLNNCRTHVCNRPTPSNG